MPYIQRIDVNNTSFLYTEDFFSCTRYKYMKKNSFCTLTIRNGHNVLSTNLYLYTHKKNGNENCKKKTCIQSGSDGLVFERHWFLLFDKGAQSNPANFWIAFGNLAIVTVQNTVLDPWLCVPVFQRVCPFTAGGNMQNPQTKDQAAMAHIMEISAYV